MADTSADKRLKNKAIKEIVNPRLIRAPADLSVSAALELMQKEKSAYLVVVENETPAGMFTEQDVVNKVMAAGADMSKPVSAFMTPNPVCLSPDDTVGTAIDLMSKHRFYHIPLVDASGRIAGILSVRTLIRYLAEFYPAEVFNLPPDPHQVMKTREGG